MPKFAKPIFSELLSNYRTDAASCRACAVTDPTQPTVNTCACRMSEALVLANSLVKDRLEIAKLGNGKGDGTGFLLGKYGYGTSANTGEAVPARDRPRRAGRGLVPEIPLGDAHARLGGAADPRLGSCERAGEDGPGRSRPNGRGRRGRTPTVLRATPIASAIWRSLSFRSCLSRRISPNFRIEWRSDMRPLSPARASRNTVSSRPSTCPCSGRRDAGSPAPRPPAWPVHRRRCQPRRHRRPRRRGWPGAPESVAGPPEWAAGSSESVAGCRRNQWPGRVGTGGRVTPEYATSAAMEAPRPPSCPDSLGESTLPRRPAGNASAPAFLTLSFCRYAR